MSMEQDYEFEDDNFYNDDDYDYAYQQQPYQNYQIQHTHQTKFRVMPQVQLFEQIYQIANQCTTYTALPLGWCILLLRQLKWQIENIPQYFQDIKKYRKKIKYNEKLKLPNDPSLLNIEKGTCQVCCEQGYLIRNICDDVFCGQCWLGQIQAQFSSMNPFFTCMNCETPVLYETILTIIEKSNKKVKLKARYQKLLCEQFSTINRNYQCCPGADCTYCIKIEDFQTTTVKCTCGKLFCFKCKNDDHSPITCEQKNNWENLVLKEQANAKWLAANTKLCPWCNKAVQRSAGCNYMACLCGKSFCYMCSKPWQPDHKDHFKCHIFKKSDQKNIDREKAILEKINFYGQKYTNENKVVSDLKQIDTFKKRRLLFDSLGIDLTESDFIDKVYQFAIECCQSLKWIYVYRFYVRFSNKNKQDVFQFTQGQYEKYKQQLLKKLGYDLKIFLSNLQKKYQEDKNLNKNPYIQNFLNLKANITNYYTCTKQFKQKFIEQINKVDISMIKRNSEEPIPEQIDKQLIKNKSKKS